MYIGEVEQIGAAYEDMMGQNNRLLAQLADNDRVNSEIVAERVKVSPPRSERPPLSTLRSAVQKTLPQNGSLNGISRTACQWPVIGQYGMVSNT